MNVFRTLALICSFLSVAHAEQVIRYQLEYLPSNSRVHVRITPAEPMSAPATFVMPRNYPGGYSLVLYDAYVQDIQAQSPDKQSLAVRKEEFGPRWRIGDAGETIASLEYSVDVQRMERELHSAVDSSKVRSGYLGILGYSVFGYLDGFQEKEIEFNAETGTWPVISTLAPTPSAATGETNAKASNYYALADSQILAGPDLKLSRLPGKIALVMAVYSEAEGDVTLEGQVAREALDLVQGYFGDAPFSQYTVQLELLHPLANHEYDFSQEHLDSGTFSFSTTAAITAQSSDTRRQVALFNYAHHMAHCWIPKRSYGIGYLPFTWEMPPVIDTIWFNEGFGRYAAIEALAGAMPAAEGAAFRSRQLANLRSIVEATSPFIREMPLLALSREASFMYSLDFRIGKNTYARGALMAAEMDDRIRRQTHDKKSLRDALRFVLRWTQQNHRAFEVDELPKIFAEGTGVEVRDILDRWMKAP